MPGGWPEAALEDARAVLAPFLTCASPGEYVALQGRVDMPRVVEALDAWSAVRLGALGPVSADAAEALERKRVTFLLEVSERYGLEHAEVFALYVLHTAHDDEVEGLLRRLAGDKQLGQTLGRMPGVREELEARGLALSAYPERGEQAGDVLRGLGRAARDMLSSSPASDGWRYLEMHGRREQLPAPYREASLEVERGLARRHLAPGSVALGSFDAMTFGVPLGVVYLVAGTGQGLVSLKAGEYEQAARELAPAAVVVTLYAGGRGVSALSEARSAAGGAVARARGLGRLDALRELGRQWEERLGVEGMRALAGYLRARREAAYFVAEGGADAALALHEAKGELARAQAWMSQARPQRSGASGSKGAGASAAEGAPHPGTKKSPEADPSGGLGALVDEQVGLTLERVGERLARAEAESAGPRLPRNVAALERQRPRLEEPPPGAVGNPRWGEYVAYRDKRLGELKQGKAVEEPLRWEGYERMWGWFTRGMAFEGLMVEMLRADAALPRVARRFLGDFERPRIERGVGVWKPGSGLRFADVLAIEERPLAGQPPRVEAFSFKSRNLSELKAPSLDAQMAADATEALRYYGGTVNIRRPSLQTFLRESNEVSVARIRLVYEGGDLKPQLTDALKAITATENAVPGVEVSFQ